MDEDLEWVANKINEFEHRDRRLRDQAGKKNADTKVFNQNLEKALYEHAKVYLDEVEKRISQP